MFRTTLCWPLLAAAVALAFSSSGFAEKGGERKIEKLRKERRAQKESDSSRAGSIAGQIRDPLSAGGSPLYHWWSPSRADNYLTTNPSWVGKAGDSRPPDYQFTRVAGYVVSPDALPPDGTTTLYSWYSPSLGDHFTTSDPRWIGEPGDVRHGDYQFVRLEGHLFTGAEAAGAGRLPLYSWYSPSRGDNFATTQEDWAGRKGDTKHGDYGFVRLEGHVAASAGAMQSLLGTAQEEPLRASTAVAVGASKGLTGTVYLTPRSPWVMDQAQLKINHAGFYDTDENHVRLETESGGRGSYVEVGFLAGAATDAHVVEFDVECRTAGSWRVSAYANSELRLPSGRHKLRVALPPAGRTGWRKAMASPSFTTGWTFHAVKVSVAR